MKRKFEITITVSLFVFAAIGCHSLETRANPTPSRTPKPKGLNDSCGTLDDLAGRVEVCAKPLMDLLEGTVEKWPRNNEDAQELCNSFAGAERCIRETSRKCAKGVHKTIISTLANSIQRSRKRECPKPKLPAVLKTTNCIEKNNNVVQHWMANVTGRFDVVEKQFTDPDKKLMGVCCMISDIEKELKTMFDPLCPTEGAMIVRLYRSVLEDVIELICRAPKCTDFLKGYKSTNQKDFSGLIAVILRIVFSMDL